MKNQIIGPDKDWICDECSLTHASKKSKTQSAVDGEEHAAAKSASKVSKSGSKVSKSASRASKSASTSADAAGSSDNPGTASED